MAGRAQAWAQGRRDARTASAERTQALREKGAAALDQETQRATAQARARATRAEARRRAAQQVERDRREGILPPAPTTEPAGRSLASRLPSVPGGGDVAGGLLALIVWGWVVLPFLNPPAGTSRTQAVKDVLASKFANRMRGNPLP